MTHRPAEQPSVLLRAVDMMLEDLAEKRRRERALDRQLRGTRMHIEALLVPLAAALGTLEPSEGEGPRARLARIEAEYGPPPRRFGGTPASEALLAFLAGREEETVTVAEVQAHLVRAGLAPRRRYAAMALSRFAAAALVSRTRLGTYAIHRFHPELVARRLEAVRAPVAEDRSTP